MSTPIRTLEKLLLTPPATPLDITSGEVLNRAPFMVMCPGEDVATEVEPLVSVPAVGAAVVVVSCGRRRYSIPRDAIPDLAPLTQRVTALEADTDWKPVALGSGWAAVNGWPVEVRRRAGGVHLRGLATYVSGAHFSGPVATLPAGYAPARNEALQATISAGNKVTYLPHVEPDGRVLLTAGRASSAVAPQDYISLHGTWLVG